MMAVELERKERTCDKCDHNYREGSSHEEDLETPSRKTYPEEDNEYDEDKRKLEELERELQHLKGKVARKGRIF